MALKKTLVQRLFSISKISSPFLTTNRISSSSLVQDLLPAKPSQSDHAIAPDPGDIGIFRRFLHKRALFQSTATVRTSPVSSPATGDNLIEKMRDLDISRGRIRLDGLRPPETTSDLAGGLSVEDARKLLRLSQLEMVKSKLRQMTKSCISYSEFVRICAEGCFDPGQGLVFAKMLDESGFVIVLGNTVFLRPDQETEHL